MSNLKSFDEFVNENLVTKGEYNFYGPGSLNPIIKKLIGEGKSESIIRTYLTSLGVTEWRINKAFSELSEVEIAIVSGKMNEGKKMTFEEKATKFLKDINEEEEEVSESDRSKEKDPYSQGYDDREDESIGARTGAVDTKDFGSDDKAEALKADRNESYGKFGKREEEHPNQEIDKGDEVVGESAKKKLTFEEAATAFLLGLQGSDAINDDKDALKEKLNKDSLQVEGDGEDVDDMIDDLEDGDEDEDQGPDDNAPDSDVEKKIKDGESPADAAEGDSNAKDKIKNAAEELAKDSEKLAKIKKLLGETKEVTLDDDGKEVEDKEDIEDEETGDDIQVEKAIKEEVWNADETSFDDSVKKEIAKFFKVKSIKDLKSTDDEDGAKETEKIRKKVKNYELVSDKLPKLSAEVAGDIRYSKKDEILRVDDHGITIYFMLKESVREDAYLKAVTEGLKTRFGK